jgi:uncharacterized Zn finger protein
MSKAKCGKCGSEEFTATVTSVPVAGRTMIVHCKACGVAVGAVPACDVDGELTKLQREVHFLRSQMS